MSTKQTGKKTTYTRHSAEYKQEALKLATQIGIAKAASQLGLHESQLYNWRKDSECARTVSERESSLATENARLKRQLAQQARAVDLKKCGDVFRSTTQVRYEYIKNHRVEYSIDGMSACFGVSCSGYYAWLHRKPSQRQQRRQELDGRVNALFDKHKQRYGAQRQGLVAKAARKYKATTNSKHNLPEFDNLLKQDFTATAPNQKWAGDITYLWAEEGWLYLAVILDLFSRQIVGWSMSGRMTADLVCDALQMAVFKRKRPKGVIIHSDRGGQYCSYAYRQLLEKHQMLGSMSAKGNCYDNGVPRRLLEGL